MIRKWFCFASFFHFKILKLPEYLTKYNEAEYVSSDKETDLTMKKKDFRRNGVSGV